MLVLAARDIRYRLQILAYQLAQDAVALAMQNTYTRHANKYGIVYKVLHSVEGFVATHATHVKVLVEV